MIAPAFVFIALATLFHLAASLSGSYYAASYSSSSGTYLNSGPAQTTVDLFVGPGVANDDFAASVVDADACTTTYGLACTHGAYFIGSHPYACDPAWTWFATYAPNSFRSLIQAEVGAFTGRTLLECSLDATVSAICTAFASDIFNGYHTAASTTYTISGAAELAYKQIPVTAGAAKLSQPGACTISTNAAAPTAVIDVYKVLVVPGAAALYGAFA